MAGVKPIPDGYPQVIPSLVIDGAAAAIAFYGDVLGTTPRPVWTGRTARSATPNCSSATRSSCWPTSSPTWGFAGRSRRRDAGDVERLREDVDAVFARALTAGAKELRPVENQFYGDRSGQFEDPFGHRWSVGTHVEDVPDDEMMKRAEQAMS